MQVLSQIFCSKILLIYNAFSLGNITNLLSAAQHTCICWAADTCMQGTGHAYAGRQTIKKDKRKQRKPLYMERDAWYNESILPRGAQRPQQN